MLFALLAPVIVAAVVVARGQPVPVVVLVTSSLVLFVLAFFRVSGIIDRLSREAHRDEQLRRYGERLLNADDREEAVDAARSAARSISGVDVELVPAGSRPGAIVAAVGADGAEPLELAVVGVASQRARVLAMLGVLADGLSVTFARQDALAREQEALRTLRAQNERLLELDVMKQSFMSMVSHELRTPLTSIVGYLELMREGEAGGLTEDQARFLEVMDRNASRLQRLVDDILTISRADSDRLKLTVEPVDVRQLVQRAVESAGPVARGKGVELLADAEEVLPEMAGDRRLLAQLLDNLVSNAVKFTPSGGSVTIHASPSGEEIAIDGHRHGAGDPRGGDAAAVRPLLPGVDRRRRAGHRARPGDREGDRRGPRGLDRRRERARSRQYVPRRPSARAAAPSGGAGRRHGRGLSVLRRRRARSTAGAWTREPCACGLPAKPRRALVSPTRAPSASAGRTRPG